MKKLMAILLCAAMLLGVCVTVNAESEKQIASMSKDHLSELMEQWNKDKDGVKFVIEKVINLFDKDTGNEARIKEINSSTELFEKSLQNAINTETDSEEFKSCIDNICLSCRNIVNQIDQLKLENTIEISKFIENGNLAALIAALSSFVSHGRISPESIGMQKESLQKVLRGMSPLTILSQFRNSMEKTAAEAEAYSASYSSPAENFAMATAALY